MKSNVGIGTTAPNNILDVRGTINASGLLLTNNSFSITQSGLVGIGTSSPNKMLEVNVTAPSTGIATNGTIYTPIINTTRSDNLTISSASGSVIIRLG